MGTRDASGRRSGGEGFHATGRPLGFDLLSFWQWSCSDLVGNALRGLVAEYLVARAVKGDGGMRTEWDAYDVVSSEGVKVEVKCSAYVQSWPQTRLSNISYDIARKRSWTAATNTMSSVAARCADVYVFALHAHRERGTIDPLDVDQWVFHVLATHVLDERVPTQKTIRLSSLLKLHPATVTFADLGEAVSRCASARSLAEGGPTGG